MSTTKSVVPPELLLSAKSRLEPLPAIGAIDRFRGMTVVLVRRSPASQFSTAPPDSVVPPFQARSAPAVVVLITETMATAAVGGVPTKTSPAQLPTPAVPVPP